MRCHCVSQNFFCSTLKFGDIRPFLALVISKSISLEYVQLHDKQNSALTSYVGVPGSMVDLANSKYCSGTTALKSAQMAIQGFDAAQADVLAQGLLMALLRTDLKGLYDPWHLGKLSAVTRSEAGDSRAGFADLSWYGDNPTYKFVGAGWLYMGDDEDPDYPENCVYLTTKHDNGIVFKKGDSEHLLDAWQAGKLLDDLLAAASSLGERKWRIWDCTIDWSQAVGAQGGKDAQRAKSELAGYLRSYHPG